MLMNKAELEERTKRFALRVILFVAALPENKLNNLVGYELLKSGMSIGANYREANGRSLARTLLTRLDSREGGRRSPILA